MKSEPKIGAVNITFEIIGYLVDRGPSGVATIARALDRPKSTVHDYLQSLYARGFVVKENERYRPSMRFLAVGEQTRDALPIHQAASKPLRSLADQIDLHVSTIIEEHGRVVIIDTVSGIDPVELATHSGIRMAMHTTSPGKAILAHFPQERVDEIVERHGLEAMTEQTITDRERLDVELQSVRNEGYATDDEERLIGLRTVAVPVTDREGTIHGALTVYGPKYRITDEQLHETLPRRLQETANVAEMNLNY
jgi:IclR family acetate operon transcriptional repressor